MADSHLTRSSHRPATDAGEPTVPCPGCGGRGRFEWRRDAQVPRQWSWAAPCKMCDGRGRIPATWLRGTPTTGLTT